MLRSIDKYQSGASVPLIDRASNNYWKIISHQEKNIMDTFIRNKFSYPLTEETVAQSWSGRVFSCALFIDPPGPDGSMAMTDLTSGRSRLGEASHADTKIVSSQPFRLNFNCF
jgi:hypothetical protein